MAKPSRAKVKMLQSQAMKAAAERKAQKSADHLASLSPTKAPDNSFSDQDEAWRDLGLAAPVRRALVEDGIYSVADLRKVSLAALKELEGMSPNAIRVLVAEMKKQDLSFRS